MSVKAAFQADETNDSDGPTDDGPHPLMPRHKPDAQSAAPKASFAVLRLLVARPGFGQEQTVGTPTLPAPSDCEQPIAPPILSDRCCSKERTAEDCRKPTLELKI